MREVEPEIEGLLYMRLFILGDHRQLERSIPRWARVSMWAGRLILIRARLPTRCDVTYDSGRQQSPSG